MAWIEAHQQLRDHPKTLELSVLMGWEVDLTIGKLMRFWWWCLDYAEDGDLRKHNATRLGSAVNTQDGQRWVDALVKAGWVDSEPYLRVHDWWDYVGMYLQRKYQKKSEKWRGVQQLYNSCHSPNLTKPNQTKPKNSAFDFELIWKDYPNKLGKESARRHFERTVQTEKDFFDINAALSRYKQHLQDNSWKKPQHGSTWFNGWQEWINYVEPKTQSGPSQEVEALLKMVGKK